MRGRAFVALAMVSALAAAGCATDPTGSGAPPAAPATSPVTPTASPSSPASPPSPSAPPSAPTTSTTPVSPPATELPTYPSPTEPAEPTAPPEAAPLEGPEATELPDPAPTLTADETDCVVPARFVGKDVEVMPVDEKLIALTFDAGANADGVPSILATLLDREVPATFFLTGDFVVRYPVKSARIAKRHLVGNHTYDHLDLTTVTDLRITRQVRRAEVAILETTGEDPRRFFRFPFGARDAHTITVVNGLCYVPFRWTVDTLGWKGTSGGMTVDKVVTRVLDAAKPGAIVLMHVGSHPTDGSTLDADALPTIVRKLRLRGYTLVRLSRVLAAAP